MKKVVMFVFALFVTGVVFAQPFFGPAFDNFTLPPGKDLGFVYPILPANFSGVMELKDGYTYLRSGDRLYKLTLPKIEGLVLDTAPGTGTVKMDVLGYIIPKPPLAVLDIYVVDLWVDGRKAFLPPRPYLITLP